jgi:hypothetical protein
MHIRKIKAGGVNTSLENFVGEVGTLFYDPITRKLRISDGHTPGGSPIVVEGSSGNGSIIQSATAPSSPSTSTLWYDTVGGRTYVYFDSGWVDASPEANSTGTAIPQLVSYFTNDIGYLTSSTVNSYIHLPPTFTVTNVSYFTNDIGYLTSSTVNSYVTRYSNLIQSPSAPTGSTATLWYSTTAGRLFTYYSSQWIDTSPTTLGITTLNNKSVSGFLASWQSGDPFQWFIINSWSALQYLTAGTQLQITYPTGSTTTYTESFTLAADIVMHSDEGVSVIYTTTTPTYGLYGGITTVVWSYATPTIGVDVQNGRDFVIANTSTSWTFGATGILTLPGSIKKSTDLDISIGGSTGNWAIITEYDSVTPAGTLGSYTLTFDLTNHFLSRGIVTSLPVGTVITVVLGTSITPGDTFTTLSAFTLVSGNIYQASVNYSGSGWGGSVAIGKINVLTPKADWTFNDRGELTFPDSTAQSTAFTATSYINKATLKSVVAASTSFTDFQTRIASL